MHVSHVFFPKQIFLVLIPKCCQTIIGVHYHMHERIEKWKESIIATCKKKTNILKHLKNFFLIICICKIISGLLLLLILAEYVNPFIPIVPKLRLWGSLKIYNFFFSFLQLFYATYKQNIQII